MVILKAGSRPPWVGLGAAVWVQISGGNPTSFPLYSHTLKSVMGLSQQRLSMIAVAVDIGENVGLLPGVVCNKFPPWAVLLVGTLCCFLGYGVLWLAVTQTVHSMPYWALWFASCLATNSSAWLCTAVLVTNMRNFPLSRGTLSGILKGYGGLSAAVYTEIYTTVLRKSSSKLLLFLALGIPILCLSLMYFIRACTPASGEDPSETKHFLFIQISSILLGIYLLSTTVLDHVLSTSAPVSYTFLAIMVVFLLVPLAIPVKMTLFPSNLRRSGLLARPSGSSDQLALGEENTEKIEEPLLMPSSSSALLDSFHEGDSISDVNFLLAVGEGAVKKKRRPKRGEDFNLRQAFVKADFWLLFWVYFVGAGTAVTVVNNLAQIGIAEGVDDTTVLLSLYSFCNFLGRLGGGVVSEYFVRSRTIPRTIWMTFTLIIMVMTHLLLASALSGTIYVGIALTGICVGMQFSSMVPTASELFGLKHFGVIYNFMLLGNPIGALLLSGGLAGYIYDKEAAKQQGLNLLHSTASCLGPNCFRLTFLVLAGVCVVGTLLSIILTIRIRPVYQMLYSGGSFRLPQTANH